jgi:hypothetical protein
MKTRPTSMLLVALLAFGGLFVALRPAGAQEFSRPGLGIGQGPHPNIQVVDSGSFLYIIRPDRVIKVNKESMLIAGQTELPLPR